MSGKNFIVSEANLRSLIDAREESIWSIDREYNYTIFNRFFEDEYFIVFNKRLKKGMNALDILSPELKKFWNEKYLIALNGEKLDFEFFAEIEGELHTYRIILNPIFENDLVTGVSAISTDITKKKELGLRLRESEERFRTAFHTSPDSININRMEDGLYIDVNQGFTDITGFSREETVGKTSAEISIWADLKDRKRLVKGLKENGIVNNMEAKFRMKDGKIITGLMSAKIITLNGEPHILSITKNIEELKKIESEREKLLKQTQKARDLLGTVFSRTNDGVVALDKDWIYTYVNPRAAKLLNRKNPEDLIGKHIWTEYPEGIDQRFYNSYYKAMKNQKQIFIEEYYKPWDRWFENRIYPSSSGLTIYFSDITERKKNELILVSKEKELTIINKVGHKLNSVLDKKECVRIILEEILEITNASASFLLIRKGEDLEAEEILFKDPLKKFKEFPVHKVAECLCGLAVKENKSFFSKDIFKDTRCTWDECKDAGLHSAAAIPLFKEGEAFAVLGLGSFEEIDFEQNEKFLEILAGDFSIYLQNALLHEEIKKHAESLEEKVKKRTKELEDSNRELEAFSYSVSHDLRAPLRAISGFSKMLDEDFNDKLSDDGKELLEDIIENTKKMGDLIDDLLSLARIGRKKINKSEFDISSLFSVSFKELKVINPGKDIELKMGKMPRAKCDQLLIKQVALNLLSNAIKFSSGKKKIIIKVSGRKIKNGWEYSVSDNGVGFDMRYKDKLFGVFQRLHSQDEFAGTGVGLAIVKKIIDIHGGNVWAESKLDVGSKFYFTLNNNDK